MVYLFSNYHCVISGKNKTEILPFVKYEVAGVENEISLITSFCEGESFGINFYDLLNKCVKCKNICVACVGCDKFIFLFKPSAPCKQCVNFLWGKKNVCVTVGSEICIFVDGEMWGSYTCCDVEYNHFEICGENLIVYFSGVRKFLCVLEEEKIAWANYFDEQNLQDGEKYFMGKQLDFLSHGKVCHIKDNSVETYCAYTDNNDLNLCEEFVPFVFLDCVIAGNFSYCKNLLCDDLKNDDVDFTAYFGEIDLYFCLTGNVFAVFKKNTLTGIYKFEVENKVVTNIVNLLEV
ncbi:MAG: hypothetical protein MJ149_00020 [Clostridia bacterium]|nr:hypothetical protein [Clostridia bacterium]